MYNQNYYSKIKTYNKGIWAEYIAQIFLFLKGYRTLNKRYKNKFGEIDLILQKSNEIIFVEVKFRSSHAAALEAISYKQRQRIITSAKIWIANNSLQQQSNQKKLFSNKDKIINYRFDVITISPWKIPKHIRNAFTPNNYEII